MSDTINVGDFVRANIYSNRVEYGEVSLIINVPLARLVGSVTVYVVNGFLVQRDKLEKATRQP